MGNLGYRAFIVLFPSYEKDLCFPQTHPLQMLDVERLSVQLTLLTPTIHVPYYYKISYDGGAAAGASVPVPCPGTGGGGKNIGR
jgi:hypothetical protein